MKNQIEWSRFQVYKYQVSIQNWIQKDPGLTILSYIFNLGSENQGFKIGFKMIQVSSIFSLDVENQGFKIGFKMIQVSSIFSLDVENQGFKIRFKMIQVSSIISLDSENQGFKKSGSEWSRFQVYYLVWIQKNQGFKNQIQNDPGVIIMIQVSNI